MTMLSTKYGEDWTAYLQAIVFSYNASVCRSTGYAPYFLMHGREATLLEDVAMEHVHENVDDDIILTSKRLKEAYKLVIAQQQRVADLNRQRQENNKLASIEYNIDDHVMHWEPAQSKMLHAAAPSIEEIAPKAAPGKWKPRWTGPHKIIKKSMGTYGFRYTVQHSHRKRAIENVKADKLYPYQPWNEHITSTSPNIDEYDKSYKIGHAWCDDNEMIIVATKRPEPFGVCKTIKIHDDCTIKYQWYAADENEPHKPFLPMWVDENNSAYTRATRRNANHQPLTGEEEGGTLHQKNVLFSGFTLSKKGHLPIDLIDACANHQDIWWAVRSDNRKKIIYNMNPKPIVPAQ
jgi:hypothetical protein